MFVRISETQSVNLDDIATVSVTPGSIDVAYKVGLGRLHPMVAPEYRDSFLRAVGFDAPQDQELIGLLKEVWNHVHHGDMIGRTDLCIRIDAAIRKAEGREAQGR